MKTILGTYETDIKTLLKYGFEWSQVEYYTRHPEELEKIFERIANNEK